MRHSLLALALCLNGSVAAQGLDLRLPDFGDPSAQHLGRHQEAQLGAEMMQRLRQRGVLIEDVQLAEYLDSVGQRIATGAGGGHPYTFFWVDDDRINAFAAPGSYVGVNTGLLLATRNEAEFAGVVAHEVAHVAQRHIARRYAEARRLQLPVAAALAASAALAAASGEAGQAAMASTLAASAQRQISYTRGSEQEADRVGQRLLEQAGFDPRGMASFFAFLARSPEEAANQLPDYLRTHPSPDDRLAPSSRVEGN
ncbi:MAG: M48 family metalloprotease, partial [Candidatus Competibacterales bacterium]|nr:M48 family metalloprotease [Candidatus Competibacterales bacterium]